MPSSNNVLRRQFVAGASSLVLAGAASSEAKAIFEMGVRIVIHESMTEAYILGVARAVKKVA